MDAATLELIGRAHAYGYEVDIGQLSKADRRALDRMAKRGEVTKARLAWPWLASGTCIKTFYINNAPAGAEAA